MSLSADELPTQSDSNESRCSSEPYEDPTRVEIQNDLKSMSFEEIMKLKAELGAKIYKEAVLGVAPAKTTAKRVTFKRLNKNRPREASAKKQVPFIGGVQPAKQKAEKAKVRDPRFDKNSGDYDPVKFKENYKFLGEIREKEVAVLQNTLEKATEEPERKKVKFVLQRLKNKLVEDERWNTKQKIIEEEKEEIKKAKKEGRKPHYPTKKEHRAKVLVARFLQLKENGSLSKHLEKKRKKNAAKDRKKINIG